LLSNVNILKILDKTLCGIKNTLYLCSVQLKNIVLILTLRMPPQE